MSWSDRTESELLRAVRETGFLLVLFSSSCKDDVDNHQQFAPRFEFGCDMRSYVLGKGSEFRGMKLLPPGLRFFHYSCGKAGMKQAFFTHIVAGDVAIRCWDRVEEDFVGNFSQDTAGRSVAAVRSGEMDKALGAYNIEDYPTWLGLANHIDESVLESCGLPVGGIITAAENGDENEGLYAPSFTPGFIVDIANELRAIKRKAKEGNGGRTLPKYLQNVSGSDLTRLATDHLFRLRIVLREEYGGKWSAMFGELQLCFLLLLYISSQAALEQWKRMFSLLCASVPQMISTDNESSTGEQLLRVLQCQLDQIPQDFFADAIASDNFMGNALRSMFDGEDDDDDEQDVALSHFRGFLIDRFGEDTIFCCASE